MKRIVPDYYPDFSCIAGACRHSCCVGWEIDIDPDSLDFYRSQTGSFGKRLQENITGGEDGACFRLDAQERCPFLNSDGLCDMILELGEDSLCQICADHPRFRNFFFDREETGLGLCCEAAGELILCRERPVTLQITDDDGWDEETEPEEEALLALREEMFAIAQDRSICVEARIVRMLAHVQATETVLAPELWAEFFLTLERLDDGWTRLLERLNTGACVTVLPDAQQWELPFEQLLVYLIYRHIAGALDDGCLSERVQLCALMWQLIRSLCALQAQRAGKFTLADMIEICRLYSSEIEYSDENIDAILAELRRRSTAQ